MDDFEYSKHAMDMIIEREIDKRWISDTITKPDYTKFVSEEEFHYIKQINEYGNRFLRVVVNPKIQPKKIITIFFDRRLRR